MNNENPNDFKEESNIQKYLHSMAKNGEINEEEVIDFINNRICSLKLQKELAKLQMKHYL